MQFTPTRVSLSTGLFEHRPRRPRTQVVLTARLWEKSPEHLPNSRTPNPSSLNKLPGFLVSISDTNYGTKPPARTQSRWTRRLCVRTTGAKHSHPPICGSSTTENSMTDPI
ncbi:hypothetical protein [Connecticut virus]|uniref:Uncharacterized protein n=1 Tax=Connecticut virus TaxID=1272962 RepID=A0A0D3R289_9RHAB|nr:hypothetical protein QKJ48_gp3 [Connecticut virus]AJR28565.1 hypothetical protein [Connecticut virus]